MSSSFWWNDEDFNNTIMMKGPPPQAAVYVDSGDSGPDNDDEVVRTPSRLHSCQCRSCCSMSPRAPHSPATAAARGAWVL